MHDPPAPIMARGVQLENRENNVIKELSSEQARQSSVADQAAEPCSVVLKEVHRCGRLGATHEELCIATGLAKTRLSAALHDLKRDKLVIVIKHGRGRGEPIFVIPRSRDNPKILG